MDLGPMGWDLWALWMESFWDDPEVGGRGGGVNLSCQPMKTEPYLREVSLDASDTCHYNSIAMKLSKCMDHLRYRIGDFCRKKKKRSWGSERVYELGQDQF